VPYRRALTADFARSIREHPDWPVVVSEGDSWFSYSDVVGRLDDPGDTARPRDQRRWSLLRLERAGDEILTILSGSQRALLRRRIAEFEIDALLFSAGGNDVLGPDLLPLLRDHRPGMSAPDLVAFARFERRLRQIADCYRELLDLIGDAGRATKVFAASYDYPVPGDRPVKLLWGALEVSGPWLLPALRARRIPATLWPDVVRLLVDGFCATLDQVAAEPRGAGRLVRVETRSLVGRDWRDEIHPNRRAAKRIAKAFETALAAHGVL
jgi:hypothetical protein